MSYAIFAILPQCVRFCRHKIKGPARISCLYHYTMHLTVRTIDLIISLRKGNTQGATFLAVGPPRATLSLSLFRRLVNRCICAAAAYIGREKCGALLYTRFASPSPLECALLVYTASGPSAVCRCKHLCGGGSSLILTCIMHLMLVTWSAQRRYIGTRCATLYSIFAQFAAKTCNQKKNY